MFLMTLNYSQKCSNVFQYSYQKASFSGYYLQKYGMTYKQLKAIILMGACLPRTTKLQDYPLPVLTLAAELDGITRITRVAEEYAKLKQELKTSFLALYKTPVILIEGGNHAQFASGKMPRILADKDLIPDVTLSPSLNNPRVLTANMSTAS